jgi:predicted DNA-binding protein YlxM (UPF0122 family)
MAKLTEQDKAEILKQYACGYSASEIAKKFKVSHTAISKILKNIRSCNENEKVSEKFQKVAKQNNHELAKTIIDKAMLSVVKDIDKCSPKDRISIVERLMLLYGNNENQKSALDRVIDAITGVINEE